MVKCLGLDLPVAMKINLRFVQQFKISFITSLRSLDTLFVMSGLKVSLRVSQYKRKLESVYFDRSGQNRAFRYFKILPMLFEYRIL